MMAYLIAIVYPAALVWNIGSSPAQGLYGTVRRPQLSARRVFRCRVDPRARYCDVIQPSLGLLHPHRACNQGTMKDSSASLTDGGLSHRWTLVGKTRTHPTCQFRTPRGALRGHRPSLDGLSGDWPFSSPRKTAAEIERGVKNYFINIFCTHFVRKKEKKCFIFGPSGHSWCSNCYKVAVVLFFLFPNP